METYKIEVREFLSKVIDIEADSADKAISKIKELYKNEKVVLNYNDFIEVDFVDINNQSKNDEKKELISNLIDYLYEEEKKHFEEAEKPKNHIFLKIKRLKSLTC